MGRAGLNYLAQSAVARLMRLIALEVWGRWLGIPAAGLLGLCPWVPGFRLGGSCPPCCSGGTSAASQGSVR